MAKCQEFCWLAGWRGKKKKKKTRLRTCAHTYRRAWFAGKRGGDGHPNTSNVIGPYLDGPSGGLLSLMAVKVRFARPFIKTKKEKKEEECSAVYSRLLPLVQLLMYLEQRAIEVIKILKALYLILRFAFRDERNRSYIPTYHRRHRHHQLLQPPN